MTRVHRGVVALLLLVLAGSGLAASGTRNPLTSASGPGTSVAGNLAASAAAVPPGGGRRDGPLPDSLLARVGNRRDISISGFRSAWSRLTPPDRPDSLTPHTAREFLELLIGKEALGEAALRERWVWTAGESAGYLGLRDHMVLRAMLDSTLGAARARLLAAGDSVPDEGALGVIARDQRMASLGVAFDQALLERLARAFGDLPRPSPDSSLASQLRALGAVPHVEDSLLPRPVASGSDMRYTVADLLDGWKRASPVSRPRVERADQVRDLASNGIFERALRRDGEARRVAERPELARALAEKREFIAVSHFVAREVYAKIATDSVTLERHYRDHIDDWSLPLRVRIIRMVLADRAAGVQMRMRLASQAEAESLAERAARAGADYRATVTAASDSALFARVLAAGTSYVIGPDSVSDGWAVTRVTEILPPRRRTLDEARSLVYHDWYGKEGERLMAELIARARRATTVIVNQRALARIGT